MGLNFKNRDDDDFDSATYVRVNDRLIEFWAKHPTGAIVTDYEIVEGSLVMTAKAYRDANDAHPAGTGHAFLESLSGEKVGEFTETVAVGRALAMMGFKVEKSIASGEEMKRFEDGKRAKKAAQMHANEAEKRALKEAQAEINKTAENSEDYVSDKMVEELANPEVPTKLKASGGFNLNKIRKTSQPEG